MSLNNFISFLQQILTMVNSNDKYSVAFGKSVLSSTIAFAVASEKIDYRTERIMWSAECRFNFLVENAKDYSGKPGNYHENEKRRRRLLMTLEPSC